MVSLEWLLVFVVGSGLAGATLGFFLAALFARSHCSDCFHRSLEGQ